MKKIFLKKELVCPFDKCRTPYGIDKDGNEVYSEMGVDCEHCEYVWDRNTTTLERPLLSNEEHHKLYEEYEIMYKPICIDLDKDLEDLQSNDSILENIDRRCRGE